jgi:hypothetical protein
MLPIMWILKTGWKIVSLDHSLEHIRIIDSVVRIFTEQLTFKIQ